MLGLEVLASGPYSVIQDLGRYGQAHLGRANAGAMDEYAYRWSQKLLGNTNANAIEVLLSGLTLKVHTPTTIAVCGADLGFCINGQEVRLWSTHKVKKGDLLSFTKRYAGVRAYLAVKGGFSLEKVAGAYAYCDKEKIGLKLSKGVQLKYKQSKGTFPRKVQAAYIPHYKETLTLRILLASKEETKRLRGSYTLTNHISPMGYKLQGEPITYTEDGIISEGIAFGAVQVPADGQPIILLKERQSIGGYDNIGTVLAKDCFALAQLPIGASVTFKAITVEEAQEEMKKFYAFFDDCLILSYKG